MSEFTKGFNMHDMLGVLIFRDFPFNLKYCTSVLKLNCWGGKKTADHSVVLQIIQREIQCLKAVSFSEGHLLADRTTVSEELYSTIMSCLYWDLEIKDLLLK